MALLSYSNTIRDVLYLGSTAAAALTRRQLTFLFQINDFDNEVIRDFGIFIEEKEKEKSLRFFKWEAN